MTLEPLAIPVDEAFEVVGCKNTKQFLREVDEGIWPKPLPINSRPRRWSVEALKRKADELAGLTPRQSDPQEWRERLKTGGI